LMTKPDLHGGHDYLPGFRHDALLPLYDVVQRLAGIPALHSGPHSSRATVLCSRAYDD